MTTIDKTCKKKEIIVIMRAFLKKIKNKFYKFYKIGD